jgi:peptidoglycan LD-endopeptidase CwlK
MPAFSGKSKAILATCHPDLQRLFNTVIKTFDCSPIDGYRNKKDQDAAVAGGKSKTPWPTSKHNSQPSMAVDVMPYPINWSDDPHNIEKLNFFGGYVMGVASQMGIKIRWGHDWDRNLTPDERGLVDRPHFELI